MIIPYQRLYKATGGLGGLRSWLLGVTLRLMQATLQGLHLVGLVELHRSTQWRWLLHLLQLGGGVVVGGHAAVPAALVAGVDHHVLGAAAAVSTTTVSSRTLF